MPSLRICWPPARKCASLRKCWDNYDSPNLQLPSQWKTVMADLGPCLICEVPETTQAETGFLQHHDRFFTALCASIVLCRSKLWIKASQLFDCCLETYTHLVLIRMSLWSNKKTELCCDTVHSIHDCSPHFWYFQVNNFEQPLYSDLLKLNWIGWSHEARRLCFHTLLLLQDKALQSLQCFHLRSIFGPSWVHRHRVPVSEHLTSYLVSSMSAKSLATWLDKKLQELQWMTIESVITKQNVIGSTWFNQKTSKNHSATSFTQSLLDSPETLIHGLVDERLHRLGSLGSLRTRWSRWWLRNFHWSLGWWGVPKSWSYPNSWMVS